MPILLWNKDLDIGVRAMNDEHQRILDYMNRLFDRNKAGAPKPELEKLLKEFGAYTVRHFANEESYMASIHYPAEAFNSHKLIHQRLIKKFTEYAEAFVSSSVATLPDDFFGFLRIWLSGHIQGIDKKYSEHKH